jgi:hypothetical protein
MPYQPPLGDPSLPQPNIPPPFPPPLPISFRTPSRMPWIVAVAMTAAAGYGAYWGFSERTKWKAKAEVAEGKAREALAAGDALNRQLCDAASGEGHPGKRQGGPGHGARLSRQERGGKVERAGHR